MQYARFFPAPNSDKRRLPPSICQKQAVDEDVFSPDLAGRQVDKLVRKVIRRRTALKPDSDRGLVQLIYIPGKSDNRGPVAL